jgi:hypothetical protein
MGTVKISVELSLVIILFCVFNNYLVGATGTQGVACEIRIGKGIPCFKEIMPALSVSFQLLQLIQKFRYIPLKTGLNSRIIRRYIFAKI